MANEPSRPLSRKSFVSILRLVCAASLCICLLVAVIASRNWPLIGDTSLMHYVVFLMHRGLFPYRDIADINLPGTYLADSAAMSIFGSGAIGWRLYDFTLAAAALGACFALAGRKRWFAALFAGCTLPLVHLADGVMEGGQRDWLIAVLLLWACVPLLAVLRGKRSISFLFFFGLILGATFTIKPVLVPLAVALLVLIAIQARLQKQNPVGRTLAAIAGMSLPAFDIALWLRAHGALSVFWTTTLPLVRLHATIDRKSLGFLLAHCISPLTFAALLWLLLLLRERPRFTIERTVFFIALAGAILGYILQHKGFTYQRYPELAILLILIGIDIDRALEHHGLQRIPAAAIALFTCFFLAPRLAWLTTTFSSATPFQNALTEQLNQLGGTAQLAGNVQCLDTASGCINVLYNMRIRQSTGFLYDCYLFTGPSRERDRYRAAFWAAYTTARPRVLIVTNDFCLGLPNNFSKLDRWPELDANIQRNYREQIQWQSQAPVHYWKRWEDPPQFRIYVRQAGN